MNHEIKKLTATVLTLLGGSALCLSAEENPYLMEDDSWISLSGEVTTVDEGEFRIDYGDGLVTVEMDTWTEAAAEDLVLFPGERVTVTGRIDDDLWEMTSIEAFSVFVEDRSSYFFADPTDEEAITATPGAYATSVPAGSNLTLTGTVTEVDGREFWMDTGTTLIEVDTIEMGYNPLDDQGLQQVGPGDVVQVSGEIESGFFDNRELHAEVVITVSDATS